MEETLIWTKEEFDKNKDNINEVISGLRESLLCQYGRAMFMNQEIDDYKVLVKSGGKNLFTLLRYEESIQLELYLELLMTIDNITLKEEYKRVCIRSNIYDMTDIFKYQKDGKISVAKVEVGNSDGEIFVLDNVALIYGSINFLKHVKYIGYYPSVNFSNTDLYGIQIGRLNKLKFYLDSVTFIREHFLYWLTHQVEQIDDVYIEMRWYESVEELREEDRNFLKLSLFNLFQKGVKEVKLRLKYSIENITNEKYIIPWLYGES